LSYSHRNALNGFPSFLLHDAFKDAFFGLGGVVEDCDLAVALA
jgi:hypothetical protein